MGSWFSSRKIPRPKLIFGIYGRGKVLYQRTIIHTSQMGHYGMEITCPSAAITGITCFPVEDDRIQSPEAKVKSGGVNCKHVNIYLTPIKKDDFWGYVFTIRAELNNETRASQQVRID